MKTLREIYEYREMIFSLVKRDLRGRYKGSVLGFLWTFLNPLFQMLVYTMVFSFIMRASYDKYYLFLFVGLIPWIFFSTSVGAGASCLRNQKDMINKIYFPREVIPISYVTSQLINMLLSILVILAVVLVTGHGINPVAMIYLPLIIVIEYILAMGLAFIVSAADVYFQDLEYIMSILMMAWQFMSPVMYGLDMVPEKVQNVFNLNPMSSIIVAYRDVLYYKQIPHIHTLIQAAIEGIVFLILGFVIFEKMKKHFSEKM